MKSTKPKVTHEVGGTPLIWHPLGLCQELKIKEAYIVISPILKKLNLPKNISVNTTLVEQTKPLGTAHAVMMALKKIRAAKGEVLILNGDTPLIKKESITQLFLERKRLSSPFGFLSSLFHTPAQLGRVMRHTGGLVSQIVEAKDATPFQLQTHEINAGVYSADLSFLKKNIKGIKQKNKQREYYLTDLVQVATQKSLNVVAIPIHETEAIGINTQQELAMANQIFFSREITKKMETGVSFIHPESVVIENNVHILSGTKIYGPCFLGQGSRIGKNCIIEQGCQIHNSQIEEGVHIKAFSYLTDSSVGTKSTIGPFSHLRPQTKLGVHVKVGNFVEIKKSTVDRDSKINHLSYIGDATIGKRVNIGAGTITCNYDGTKKYQTILKDDVFVGSDTQFVAPVTIGAGAFIGAGSTITKNVESQSLALSRSQQKQIKHWAKKKGNSRRV